MGAWLDKLLLNCFPDTESEEENTNNKDSHHSFDDIDYDFHVPTKHVGKENHSRHQPTGEMNNGRSKYPRTNANWDGVDNDIDDFNDNYITDHQRIADDNRSALSVRSNLSAASSRISIASVVDLAECRLSYTVLYSKLEMYLRVQMNSVDNCPKNYQLFRLR